MSGQEARSAAQDRAWLRDVGQRDLTDIHHALRMIVKHPMVSGEEARLFTNLADACWNEHTRRGRRRAFGWRVRLLRLAGWSDEKIAEAIRHG